MTSFPIFTRLQVDNYGLFPGTKRKPGIDIDLQSGLTLVLGANGLGKTTLVSLIYRLCVGTYDIGALTASGELGGKKIQARKQPLSKRRWFAERVNDGAVNATATLNFELGSTSFSVTRALDDLDLLELRIDQELAPAEEAQYQRIIEESAGVNVFGEWILLLRHLAFYFEDRRALVWDPSAQRQLLRLLFLSPRASKEWVEAERDVLQRDSAARNTQAVLSRLEQTLAAGEEAASSDGEIREELAALQELQAVDQPKLDDLNGRVSELDERRNAARLDALTAEGRHESAYRDLERLQIQTIAAAFPTSGDTARYLMAQLVSDGICLACGHRSPKTSANLKKRLEDKRCVVCNSSLEPSAPAPSQRTINKAQKTLDAAAENFAAMKGSRDALEAEFEELVGQIQKLNRSVAERSARIDSLAKRLPPGDSELHEQRSEISVLRGRVEVMKAELDDRRDAYSQLIKRTSREIVSHKDHIQKNFLDFAEGFLLEKCELKWAPHKDTIGEAGPAIQFPAFVLVMGGTDFSSPQRRRGPDQVSESQREFIDLAFRMALIRVAGTGGSGSIVIDAPESSLDAVFVSRAAEVLTRFASEGENRLVITSNLVEGDLIPELMRRAKIHTPSNDRVVDLLKIAEPTTATRTLSRQYSEVRDRLFSKARRGSKK